MIRNFLADSLFSLVVQDFQVSSEMRNCVEKISFSRKTHQDCALLEKLEWGESFPIFLEKKGFWVHFFSINCEFGFFLFTFT
jgi:hypothetical protein